MSEIIFIVVKAFVIGFISYFLYSLWQTNKQFKRKPIKLELDLPNYLGFKVTHQVKVEHWLYDKDFGINHELRTIYTVIQEYQDLLETGVCVKVPTVDEISLVSGKVFVRGKEVGKYFY